MIFNKKCINIYLDKNISSLVSPHFFFLSDTFFIFDESRNAIFFFYFIRIRKKNSDVPKEMSLSFES